MIKEVPNTGGKLFASACGTIYGTRGKPLKPNVSNAGYLRVCYYDGTPTRKKVSVHRAVATAWLPGEGQVNHKDGDKTNNSVSNLEWCTQSENMRHAELNGTHNGRRKITGYAQARKNRHAVVGSQAA